MIQEEDVSTVNLSVSSTEVYNRGEKDISFFASLCLPTICITALPEFYIAAWHLLASRPPRYAEKILRFALGLPRGHAKTTFIKVLIAWFIVYDKMSFILIVCSNGQLAERLLADVADILRSPNIVQIYGDWESGLSINTQDTKRGAFHGRSVTLVASGWAAGIRGINLQNERPDFIFCDDVQTRKNDESPTERENLLQELTGSIFKAISSRGNRLIVYVGNMYSDMCILNQFAKNPFWVSMITGAILADGKALWPELRSLEALREEFEHDSALGLARVWFAEVMNDPRSAATSLITKDLPELPLWAHSKSDGAFITIDPAGFRNNSDENVIIGHSRHDYNCAIIAHINGVLTPKEVVEGALLMALEIGASLIAVEDVAYQQSLLFWFNHYIQELSIEGIEVVPVSPHGRTKESRIRQFVYALYEGHYCISDETARAKFLWQAMKYKLGIKDNKDDFLDACAYGEDVRTEYLHLVHHPIEVEVRRIPAHVQAYNTAF